MDSETFLVEIEWETYLPGTTIYRLVIDAMAEDDTLIIDGVQPSEMLEKCRDQHIGAWYDVERVTTLYRFRIPSGGMSRSDNAKWSLNDLGAEEMFGGTTFDQIKALITEQQPIGTQGEILTLWELHYCLMDEDDWTEDYNLLGAVNPSLLRECLYRKEEGKKDGE